MKKLLVIIFLIPFLGNAQTRFYLSSATAAATSPSFASVWTVTTGADRRQMSTTKDNSAMTSKTSSGTGGLTNQVLNRQWVSDQLATQTLSGTFKLAFRGNVSSTANSSQVYNAFVLKIVDNTGTVRSTLYGSSSAQIQTSVLTTTLTNRYDSYSSFTSVSVQQGDRIVLEIGGVQTAASQSRTVTQSFGADNATDLPQDNTTTAANNPWIEFSATITFYTPPARNKKPDFFQMFTKK